MVARQTVFLPRAGDEGAQVALADAASGLQARQDRHLLSRYDANAPAEERHQALLLAAPLHRPKALTFVPLTHPLPSSSRRYCQTYPFAGPDLRSTIAKMAPSEGRL